MMDRRTFIASTVTATAGSVALAGCLSSGGRPEVEWEWNSRGFVGQGFQPTLLVTGDIRNVGDADADTVALTCTLKDSTGATIDDKTRRLHSIEPGEQQYFHFLFTIDEGETDAVDDITIGAEFPDAD